jgi:hypothetical protein
MHSLQRKARRLELRLELAALDVASEEEEDDEGLDEEEDGEE